MQVVVACDFVKLFFGAFLNNSKDTNSNENVLICHMRTICVSKSLHLDSFSDALREVFLFNGMATTIRVNLFSHQLMITMSGQFAVIIIIIIIIIVIAIIIIIIISVVTVFADVLFVHQPRCKLHS